MTDSSAPFTKWARLAVIVTAAGFFFTADASAQRRQPPPPPPTAVQQADEQQNRIEELEAQLRDATAQNEDLQRQLMESQRENARLRGMVGELAGVNQSLQQGQTPPADPNAAPPVASDSNPPLAGGNDQRSDNSSSLNSAQVNATGTLGTLSQSEVPSGPPPADPADVYANARSLLVGGKYADAEIAFQQYLQQFPDAQNAADARFWLAYTLLARNNYQDAASNFVDYLQHNRTAARAPEAQVRLGMALAGMGQTQQACAAFADVTRRYPNATRTVRDLATRESNAARCSA